jgi:hypothetical protein
MALAGYCGVEESVDFAGVAPGARASQAGPPSSH